MTTISYPSERFPGPPTVQLEIPDGWEPADSPTGNITVVDTNSPEHFKVNLMISVQRLMTDATLVRVAEKFAEETRGRFPDFEIVGEGQTVINGLEAVVRAQRVTPLGAPFPLFQAEALLFSPTPLEGIRDLVQLHASCPGDLAEHYGIIFRTMVNSLVVTRPVAADPVAATA